MKASVSVFVTVRFVAFHRWPKAPPPVRYLRDYHRHEFHVKAWKYVTHADRDIEFIQLKEKIQKYVNAMYAGKSFDLSCEHIAIEMMKDLKLRAVEVSEDGENGSLVVGTSDEAQASFMEV